MHPRFLLLWATLVVVAVWQLPYGRQVLYPLSLLVTFAHEMGHGLVALLVGARFDHLELHGDGSGLAVWSGSTGPLATALVAAGGLVGPAVAGVGMLVLSGAPRWSRRVLGALAAFLVVCLVLWSRNLFGIVYLLSMACALGAAAKYLNDFLANFLVHLIAVSLCLSWFSNLDYLFSSHAIVNGRTLPSDSAVIAQALFLPYWFWGGLIAAFSLACVLFGIWFLSRRTQSRAQH